MSEMFDQSKQAKKVSEMLAKGCVLVGMTCRPNIGAVAIVASKRLPYAHCMEIYSDGSSSCNVKYNASDWRAPTTS